MGALKKRNNTLDCIEHDLFNNRMLEAVHQWQVLSDTSGKCHSTCGHDVSQLIKKCSACLIGHLLSKAVDNYKDGNKASHYVDLAHNLQRWLDDDLRA